MRHLPEFGFGQPKSHCRPFADRQWRRMNFSNWRQSELFQRPAPAGSPRRSLSARSICRGPMKFKLFVTIRTDQRLSQRNYKPTEIEIGYQADLSAL